MSRTPFYDGYSYTHGPFECLFRLNEAGWRVVITDEISGVWQAEVGPAACRFEVYQRARVWVFERLRRQGVIR